MRITLVLNTGATSIAFGFWHNWYAGMFMFLLLGTILSMIDYYKTWEACHESDD